MATEADDQIPSGDRARRETSESSTDGPSDTPAFSNGLPDPNLPYGGFTWTEGGIILGAVVLITAITVVSMLTGPPCCGPSTQREFLLNAVNRGGAFLLLALASLPVFWACVRLRSRNVGWGATLAGHSVLAFVITFVLEIAREGLTYGAVSTWPPKDGGTPSPPAPLETLANLEFLDSLVPYLAILSIGIARAGYLRGRARQKQAEKLEREADQLRSQLTEARLESLRMQINPHFFHNTLHTISTMAGRDPDGIRKATARLSDLMRHVLSTSDQQKLSWRKSSTYWRAISTSRSSVSTTGSR